LRLSFSSRESLNEIMQAGGLVERLAGGEPRVEFVDDNLRKRWAANERFPAFPARLGREPGLHICER